MMAFSDEIQCSVTLSTFSKIIFAFEGNIIAITDTKFSRIQQFSEKLGLSQLEAELSEFGPLMSMGNVETLGCRRTNWVACRQIKSARLRHCDFAGRNHATLHICSVRRSAWAGIQTSLEEITPQSLTVIRNQNQ